MLSMEEILFFYKRLRLSWIVGRSLAVEIFPRSSMFGWRQLGSLHVAVLEVLRSASPMWKRSGIGNPRWGNYPEKLGSLCLG